MDAKLRQQQGTKHSHDCAPQFSISVLYHRSDRRSNSRHGWLRFGAFLYGRAAENCSFYFYDLWRHHDVTPWNIDEQAQEPMNDGGRGEHWGGEVGGWSANGRGRWSKREEHATTKTTKTRIIAPSTADWCEWVCGLTLDSSASSSIDRV